MTSGELRRRAVIAAGYCWVRYWIHWNYPRVDPWEMAISLREVDGSDVGRGVVEAAFGGFRPTMIGDHTYWIVERTDDAGRPYPGPGRGRRPRDIEWRT